MRRGRRRPQLGTVIAMTLRLLQGIGLTLAAAIAAAFAFAAAPASAYSGAQAEAQSDPSADPYSFPNIRLCCERKSGGHRRGRHHYRGEDRYDDDDYPYGDDGRWGGRRSARVDCSGAGGYGWFSSIGQAVEHIGREGRIRVRSGAECRVDGVVIDSGVTIDTYDYGYGQRARLVGRNCLTVAAPGHAPVSLRGVDVDACLVVTSGRLDLSEVNVAWRGEGEAIRVNGGSLSSTGSTVRAIEGAINADRGLIVTLNGSRFASSPHAASVLRLGTRNVTVRDSLVKGGKVGVLVRMSDTYPIEISRVEIMRGERGEHAGSGDVGIWVGGGGADDGLPTLPGLDSAKVNLTGNTISGYRDGIYVDRGASIVADSNRIFDSQRAGIYAERGASGRASYNSIKCDHGDCVCYGDDCTSRSDKDFAGGLFRTSGTRCDD